MFDIKPNVNCKRSRMGCAEQYYTAEGAMGMLQARGKQAQTMLIDQDALDMDENARRMRKNSHVSIDFHCRYRPEEMATQFLEHVNYNESGKINYEELKQMMSEEYSFVMPIDCGKMYQYVYYVKGGKIIQPKDLETIEISCIQYVKFGYLFYRFYEIVHDVRKALFYFLDDGMNRHVNFRNFRKLLTLHYNMSKEKYEQVFAGITSRGGYIDYKKYKRIMDKLDKLRIRDDLQEMFSGWRERQYDPVNLDDMDSVDGLDGLDEFSDISIKKGEVQFLNELNE